MKKSIHEIFTEISTAKNPEEELAKYEHDVLLQRYLLMSFHPDYKFHEDLGIGYPAGVKIDRDFPDDISDSTLKFETRQMYLFNYKHELNKKKRNELFLLLLERLHYTEADLLIAIKDGKVVEKYPNLTPNLVNKVFPNLILDEHIVAPVVTPILEDIKNESKEEIQETIQSIEQEPKKDIVKERKTRQKRSNEKETQN